MLSFSYRFGSRIGELGMLAVQHELRSVVSTHLLSRPAGRGATPAPGIALSLATSDVNRLASAVAIGVFPVGQLAAIAFAGAVLLAIWWPLGLAVLLGAPAILWLADRLGGGLRRRSEGEQDAAAAAAGEAADLMSGYRVIKGIHAETEASHRYRRASRTALERTLRARRAEGLFAGGMDLAAGLFVAAVTLTAGLLALHGLIGIAELITVVGLTQFLLSPLQSLGRNVGTLWASTNASAGRLLALLRETHDDADDSPDRADDSGHGDSVVRELDAGELVTVAADAHDVRRLLHALRRAHPDALIVPHGAHLFAGSVHDNVALPGTAAPHVEAALRSAGCGELQEVLPEGWATPVGEGGAGLSGGQRQRVALARALAQDAPLLVLHEPTTAVDAVTEAAIAEELRRARTRHRTVVISRSPAFRNVADRAVTWPGAGE
jgi:ABC-type multidrug transport system fused ATPase/permease subunit